MTLQRTGRVQHHAWVKLALHNYVCRKCGARKVHVVEQGGRWLQEWHTPDGRVEVRPMAPPCEQGPETGKRLAWLSERLASSAAAAGVEVAP